MEPLSGVASGMAVVSLSLQLVQSIDAINAFVRRVKDSPKEHVRLTELLTRLRALLEDVRQLLEQQALLKGICYIPTASIFACLQSCEKGIEPLAKVVKGYQTASSTGSSRLDKLKGNVKLGFKDRDITNFESRINHEINTLTAALSVSNAMMQTSVLLSMKGNLPWNQGVVTMTTTTTTTTTAAAAAAAIRASTDSPSSYQPFVRTISRTSRLPRALEWLGMSKQRSIRSIRSREHSTSVAARSEEEQIIFESDRYYWNLYWLGHGLHWYWANSKTSLVPSLAIYPVVEEFSEQIDDSMQYSDLQEVQRLLCSGVLHPFTRNARGSSLLHLAASYGRTDLCRLISAYGIQPDLDLYGRSPLMHAYDIGIYSDDDDRHLELYRFLLQDLEQIDDFTNSNNDFSYHDIITSQASGTWFWRHLVATYTGEDLLQVQTKLLGELISLYHYSGFGPEAVSTTQSVIPLLDACLIERISTGQAGLLKHAMAGEMPSYESEIAGERLVNFLQGVGVDVEAWFGLEMERLYEESKMYKRHFTDRKVFLRNYDRRGWVLWWEHCFEDDSLPGYSLLTEFTGVTADTRGWVPDDWPFTAIEYIRRDKDIWRTGPKWESRFNRRMASKARKEAAKLGQKRVRSRMPGTWIH